MAKILSFDNKLMKIGNGLLGPAEAAPVVPTYEYLLDMGVSYTLNSGSEGIVEFNNAIQQATKPVVAFYMSTDIVSEYESGNIYNCIYLNGNGLTGVGVTLGTNSSSAGLYSYNRYNDDPSKIADITASAYPIGVKFIFYKDSTNLMTEIQYQWSDYTQEYPSPTGWSDVSGSLLVGTGNPNGITNIRSMGGRQSRLYVTNFKAVGCDTVADAKAWLVTYN